ncbi:hypothetical protein LY76DRAFT_387920 [Colletotrichum caudatum]|nr:hypothetical protein LY76DRAFT_387920 [Colletotrichum caudatum]
MPGFCGDKKPRDLKGPEGNQKRLRFFFRTHVVGRRCCRRDAWVGSCVLCGAVGAVRCVRTLMASGAKMQPLSVW